MKTKKRIFSEEQLDFLKENLTIGAGNAAVAFEKLLNCDVSMKVPRIRIIPVTKIPFILENPSLSVVCVKMKIKGDLEGDMYFIVPDEHVKILIYLAHKALSGSEGKHSDEDISVISEIGNIITGNYLTAVSNICRIDIDYFVPKVARDMIQSLLDESLAGQRMESEDVLFIENAFIVDKYYVKTFLLIIPSMKFLNILLNSIETARGVYGKQKD